MSPNKQNESGGSVYDSPGHTQSNPDNPEWYDGLQSQLDDLPTTDGSEPSTPEEYAQRNRNEQSPDELASAESGAGTNDGQDSSQTPREEENDSFHEPGDGVETPDRASKYLKLLKSKRGGLIGLVLAFCVTGFWGFSVVQGPLQLVHMSKLLSRFHLSQNENFTNSRIGKLYRYARTVDAPQRRNLGLASNFFADGFEKQLLQAGVELGYTNRTGNKGTLNGLTVDPESKTGKALVDYANSKGLPLTEVDGATPRVSIDLEGSDNAIRRAVLGIATEAGIDSKTASAVARRLLAKRGAINRFHPFRDLRQAADEKVADYAKKVRKEIEERRKTGSSPAEPDLRTTTTDDGTMVDSQGREVPPEDVAGRIEAEGVGAEAQRAFNDPSIADLPTSERVSVAKGALKAKLGKATGAAALLATFCGLDALGDQIPGLKFEGLVKPMMRVGADALSMGAQVMAGQGLNMREVGIAASALHDEEKGSWLDAESIQANLGNTTDGRVKMSDSIKPNTDRPPVFREINSIVSGAGPLENVCGALTTTVGSFVAMGVDLVVAGFTGGASFAIAVGGNAAGYLGSALFMDDVVRWLVGEPMDYIPIGAENGLIADVGTYMLANEANIMEGGVKLDQSAVFKLKRDQLAREEEKMKTLSITERYLSIGNDQSLVSKIAFENFNTASPTAFIASLFDKSNSSIAQVASLSTPKAFAASTFDYYGISSYGFTLEEMDSEKYENPYANAERLLSGGADKLDKLNKDYGEPCFGMKINSSTGALESADAPKRYDELPSKCNDRNNEDLVSYRFFIKDSVTATSVACLKESDTKACSELSLDSTPSGSSASDGPVDCSSAVGNEKIICAAEGYQGIPYSNDGTPALNGGNNAEAWLERNSSPSSRVAAGIDCSGFTNLALYTAFKYKTTAGCSGAYVTGGDKNIVEIPLDQVRPGDFLTVSRVCNSDTISGHVGIFVRREADGTVITLESAGGNNTAGKRESGYYDHDPEDMGGYWKYAARYIGPGSSPQ